MKMTKFVAFTLLANLTIALIGCSSESPEIPLNSENASNRTSTEGIRSLDEALGAADDFFNQLSEGTRTNSRSIESVKVLSSENTRGSNSEIPNFYLVNYADNQGFALLGAPEQSLDIYAISPEGHLEISDTINNPALRNFIVQAEKHISDSKEDTRSIVIGGWKYTIVDKANPMLDPYVSTWHQGEPFNLKCVSASGVKKCAVGCGPLSVGMLLAYYEYPKLPYTYTDGSFQISFHWYEAINDYEAGYYEGDDYGSLADYLYVLGRKKLLDANYDLQNTTCDSDNFIRTFSALGYYSRAVFQDTELSQNTTKVTNFLKNGSGDAIAAPLIFYGDVNGTQGHFWVVDGFIKRQAKITSAQISDSLLFHCIWGQKSGSGYNNGYYTYLPNTDKISKNQQGTTTGNTGLQIPNDYTNILVFGGYTRKSDY